MRRRAVMIVVLVWMLVGCVQERPNWYFATGEIIHGPYDALTCGWQAGSYERVTGRHASICWQGPPEQPGWFATLLGKLLK